MSDTNAPSGIAPATAPLPPTAQRRVSDWVAEQLLGRIARGELVPGTRLPGERQLAEQLRVSRVSVRAALQALKTQGFLTAVQGGGTRVVSSAGAMDQALTAMVRSQLDNLLDLVEIRRALESWAARRAAERATPEQRATLRQVLAAMEAPADEGHQAVTDMDFHLELARAAGSPVYLHILSTIRDILDQMLAFHHTPPFAQGREALMLDQHRAIVEAIESRDPDRAANTVTAHLDWVLERYREMRGAAPVAPQAGAAPDHAAPS